MPAPSRHNYLPQGLQIASLQEESTVNRRRLAEATREFKRSAGEEVVRAAAPLLKSYQEEIDRLSKRAKHSENSFLELYPKLFEAPVRMAGDAVFDVRCAVF